MGVQRGRVSIFTPMTDFRPNLTASSLVENPFTITLEDLMQEFEQITMPITLVCAGNRRKEQNTVRKTKGFSWGAAGLSTALFTGTLLANVLEKAKPLRRAKYLCMEGADKLVSYSIRSPRPCLCANGATSQTDAMVPLSG